MYKSAYSSSPISLHSLQEIQFALRIVVLGSEFRIQANLIRTCVSLRYYVYTVLSAEYIVRYLKDVTRQKLIICVSLTESSLINY